MDTRALIEARVNGYCFNECTEAACNPQLVFHLLLELLLVYLHTAHPCANSDLDSSVLKDLRDDRQMLTQNQVEFLLFHTNQQLFMLRRRKKGLHTRFAAKVESHETRLVDPLLYMCYARISPH